MKIIIPLASTDMAHRATAEYIFFIHKIYHLNDALAINVVSRVLLT